MVSVSWPNGMRDRISGVFGDPEKNSTRELSNNAQESKKKRLETPPRFIIFSDTDNDLDSVKTTLRFAGVLSQKDEVSENIEGITIFHTGDLIDKNNPDLSVVEFWQHLQQHAA